MATISKKLIAVMAIATLSLSSLAACSSDGGSGSSGSGSGKVSHRLAGGELDPKQEPLKNDIYDILESDISQLYNEDGVCVYIDLVAGSGKIEFGWCRDEDGGFYMNAVDGYEEALFIELQEELAKKNGASTRNNIRGDLDLQEKSKVKIANDPQSFASAITEQLTPIMKDIYNHYGEVIIKSIEILDISGGHISDLNADGEID